MNENEENKVNENEETGVTELPVAKEAAAPTGKLWKGVRYIVTFISGLGIGVLGGRLLGRHGSKEDDSSETTSGETNE